MHEIIYNTITQKTQVHICDDLQTNGLYSLTDDEIKIDKKHVSEKPIEASYTLAHEYGHRILATASVVSRQLQQYMVSYLKLYAPRNYVFGYVLVCSLMLFIPKITIGLVLAGSMLVLLIEGAASILAIRYIYRLKVYNARLQWKGIKWLLINFVSYYCAVCIECLIVYLVFLSNIAQEKYVPMVLLSILTIEMVQRLRRGNQIMPEEILNKLHNWRFYRLLQKQAKHKL
jgi:hypothetical protein